MKPIGRSFWTMLFVVELTASSAFGGVTGKIHGKVTDKQTGEGLAGVNIILKGWSDKKLVDLERPMGAVSDINGEYFIINISPGRFALVARMVGYQQLEYTNVAVSSDRTVEVNFAMQQTVIEGEQVSVVAKREVVQADISSSQVIISAEETQYLPRNTIQEVLDLTPGVTVSDYNNKIDIRGGGSDQVMAYLDGFAMKDNVFNTPFLSYNRTSIEEITIQTGGFQAEYGELRSGLINVVTKEGGRNYNLSLDWKYSPPGYRYDGPKKYLEDKYYLMYGSDWSMDAELLKQKFPNPEDKFVGWPKYSEEKLADSDPRNDMTPNQQRQLWLWQHRGRAEGEKPDNIIDATFSGPFPGAKLPSVGAFLNNLSFMVSYRGDYTAYANPGYRDHFQEQNLMFKLRYNLSASSTLSLLGMSSSQWGMGYIDESRGSEPIIMRTGGGGSYVAQSNHLAEAKISNVGLHYEHVISPRTFLEFRISRMDNEYRFGHGPMRDSTKVKEINADYYTLQGDSLHVPGLWNPQTGQYLTHDTTLFRGDKIWCPSSYWDETPDGWVYPGISPTLDQVGKVNLDGTTDDFERSRGSNTLLRGDITSQVTNNHLIKAGFYYSESMIDRDYYQIREYAENYGQTEGEGEDISIRYREIPRYGALYFQDRIEIKGLTGNLGFRGEYFDANTKSYMPDDPFSNYYFIPNFWENINRLDYETTKPYYRVSPRFGVSYPMTVNSKIYFNYGHAYTAPDNIYRYGFSTHPRMWSNISWRGNPDLKPPKTIQYSLGYEHVLFDQYLIHSEVYYKDVTDQLGQVYYQNVFSDNPTQRYYTWDNKMYEDIIGLEFRIYKRVGRFFTGWLQTEFRGQKAGEIGYATRFVEGDPQNVSEFSKFSYPDDFLWEWTPSVDDESNDFSQPFSTVWRPGDHRFFSAAEAYEFFFTGKHLDSPQEMGFTEPNDPVRVARPNPYLCIGPYDMPFGSDIHFSMLTAVNGINYDLCNSVGLSWWTRRKGGPGLTDEEKNSIVATGKDSLLKYYGQATRRYFRNLEIGRSPYDAPEAPPPPDLTVTAGEKSVTLEWSDVSEIPDHDTGVNDFAGYRVYRAVGRNDTTFQKIWECGGKTGIPVTTRYVDYTVQRGFAYFYYVTAYDDGSQNWEQPGRSLESGKYWNMMLKDRPVHPFMSHEQISDLNNVKVVPNPYHDQSVRFNWPGEENKLLFINLPLECTIKIYTATGDLVKTIYHDNGTTEHAWNQVTDSNQLIYSGVYFFHVASDVGNNSGKFVVVRSSRVED